MPTNDDSIEQLLPLKPLDFAVLIALAEEEQYGYSLAKRIAEQSGGGIRLAPSNLYYVLDRLIEFGLIRSSQPDASDERRRWFALTPLGRRAAAAEARRLRHLMDTVERLNLLPRKGGG